MRKKLKKRVAKSQALCVCVWFRASVSGILQFSKVCINFMLTTKSAAKNSICVQIFQEIQVILGITKPEL